MLRELVRPGVHPIRTKRRALAHKILCLALALGFGGATPLRAQLAADAEVAKGIKQVEDGDLDIGIFTLDAATRRLAADPARTRELAQAHLYLGIAYLGKGHETLAKARFRDALTHDKNLSLSPDRYAPRVLELFEKAKEELGGSGTAQLAAPEAEKKKGGSKKGLVLLGVGAAAAAGIAVAAGGGTPAAAAAGETTRTTETFTGRVTLANVNGQFNHERGPIVVRASGQLEATLTWSEPNAIITMHLYDERGPANHIADGRPAAATTVQLVTNVTPKTYTIGVYQCGVPLSSCQTGPSRDVATYTLTVIHP